MLFWILAIFIYGGNEEIFWRGTLLKAFLGRFPIILSAILIGILWGFWYLPLYFISKMERGIGFIPFLFSTIMVSIILTVLRLKGSIFQSMLLHGLLNAGFMHLVIINPIIISIAQIIVLILAIIYSKDINIGESKSKTWDRFADIYDKFLSKERPAYEELSKLITMNDSQLKTLELCAGTGILTEYIADSFNDYEASDYSNEMLINLKEKFKDKDLKYSIIDCTNIDRPDNSYDLIIMANAIHILPDPEAALNEVKRILKPDGIFIVATFLRENTLKQNVQTAMMRIMGIETVNSWSYIAYQNYFIKNGWHILKTKKAPAGFPIGYVELILSSMIR
ncbi:MAG: methyltransferase domain-containing protein [Tissierellia bacterium]|nr:methyltransferase domain-containing protein [Tissierellia bacterium]